MVININGCGNNAGPTSGAIPWDPKGTALTLIQSMKLPGTVVQVSELPVDMKGWEIRNYTVFIGL